MCQERGELIKTESIVVLGLTLIHCYSIHDFQFLALGATVTSSNNWRHCFSNLGRADEHGNKRVDKHGVKTLCEAQCATRCDARENDRASWRVYHLFFPSVYQSCLWRVKIGVPVRTWQKVVQIGTSQYYVPKKWRREFIYAALSRTAPVGVGTLKPQSFWTEISLMAVTVLVPQ